MVRVHHVGFLAVVIWLAAVPARAEPAFLDPSRPDSVPPDTTSPAQPEGVHVDIMDHLRVPPRLGGPGADNRSYDRMEHALAELRDELAEAEAVGDAARQARILGSMGTLYMLLGRDEESLDALYRGAALYTMLGNARKLGELQTLIDLVSARTPPP